MFLLNSLHKTRPWRTNRIFYLQCYCNSLDAKYSDSDKMKIINTLNETRNYDNLIRYDITKGRSQKLLQWLRKNKLVNISELELIESFDIKFVEKLCNSIISGGLGSEEVMLSKKIKGQVLQPKLKDDIRQNCQSVLALNIFVNTVCWTLINKDNYEVIEWDCFSIDYGREKKLLINNIVDIAWRVLMRIPKADIYVMKAEPTTVRATGNDPDNPKIISINLQKAQLTSMVIALINARNNSFSSQDEPLEQCTYFLRPNLPFRLYGTLVGNEQVSSEQTVSTMLANIKSKKPDSFNMSDDLIHKFKSQGDFERDMLGQCLLLAITFMDVCVYQNLKNVIELLNKKD